MHSNFMTGRCCSSCLAGQAAIASPILHRLGGRDLKSPNLLVDKHGWVQAIDFKLSSMLRSIADLCSVLPIPIVG